MSESKANEFDRDWESFVDSFAQRRWKSLCSTWPKFIPPIQPPGSPPSVTLTDFFENEGIFLAGPPPRKKFSTISASRGAVPEIVLHEAIFWLHKASHVLGASEIHLDNGLPTWSLPSAYQTAIFAARSIMAFFGVGLGELNFASVAVDICRNVQGMRPQRLETMGPFEEDIPFRSMGVLFDHRQIWTVFQRLLRVTTCEIWPAGIATYFSLLDIAQLTKQRHGLYYQLDYWVMEDLHSTVFDENFSDVKPLGTGREMFNCESKNFSLVAAYGLTQMAFLLFKDLCKITNRLVAEQNLIATTLSEERHPVFCDILRQCAGMPAGA